MIGGLTYDQFAQMMRDFEKDCTAAEIDRAWAKWCREHESKQGR